MSATLVKRGLQDLSQAIELAAEKVAAPRYEPTGLQEDIIYAVGCGKYRIILALDCNKSGKTATARMIERNIFWPCDEEWFAWWEGQSVFKEWPYKTKRFWITGTSENLSDNGAVREEINKWWPIGKWGSEKGGKDHHSIYWTDTGWRGKVLTYNQEPREWEGPMVSFVSSDEPPKACFIGSITSRLAEGGIWLITATPLECGEFLDILEDLEEKGTKVKRVSGSVYENSVTNGKPNHKGTKRGLWTDQQIKEYVASIPIEEHDARVLGKYSNKSGLLYPMFDRNYHVKEFDKNCLDKCNCFMSIDPHRKYYPAVTWWAITPDAKLFCYNEWPTKEVLGGKWYSEIRFSLICALQWPQMAKIFKSYDGTAYGAKILARIVDPYFAAGIQGEYGNQLEGMLESFARLEMEFTLPPRERIAAQKTTLEKLLGWDKNSELTSFNCPDLYIAPHCENMARAFARGRWTDDDKAEEDPEFKDFLDTARNLMAYLGGRVTYKEIETEKVRQRRILNIRRQIEKKYDCQLDYAMR